MQPLKRVNCAACRVELIGESGVAALAILPMCQQEHLPRPVAGRIRGRPYCGGCLAEHRPQIGRDHLDRRTLQKGLLK
jgi:hypothetical protein